MSIILAVSLFGSGAISIVWLRMEISATAKKCGNLEDQREMVARELRELRGRKSTMLRPSVLAQLVIGEINHPDRQGERFMSPSEKCIPMGNQVSQEKTNFPKESFR